jgi:hypothetical protein
VGITSCRRGRRKATAWLTLIPGAECEKKDSKALETLSPANREAWFAEHTLPEHIRYYSVVSFPDPENISNGLQRSHKKLAALQDGRNDSQLVFYDQVIPGSTILGFFNADHWAMSVPIARQHEVSQASLPIKMTSPERSRWRRSCVSSRRISSQGPPSRLAPEDRTLNGTFSYLASAATILGGLSGKSLNRTPVD